MLGVMRVYHHTRNILIEFLILHLAPVVTPLFEMPKHQADLGGLVSQSFVTGIEVHAGGHEVPGRAGLCWSLPRLSSAAVATIRGKEGRCEHTSSSQG